MKSVVTEITGRNAVLLSDDGTFMKTVNKNYRVGQAVNSPSPNRMAQRTMRWVISAAAALVLLGSGTAFAYYTPYSYASVDINPSIALKTNIFNKVISAVGVNSDGQILLKNVVLLNTDFSRAIKQIVKEAATEGYIKLDKNNGIIIVVASNQDSVADEQVSEAKQEAECAMSEAGAQGDVVAEHIGYDRVKEARALGITPGKLNLVEKYIKAVGGTSDISIKDLASKPVREIMALTKAARAEAKASPGPSETAATASPTPGATATPEASDCKDSDKDKDGKDNGKDASGNKDNGQKDKDNNGRSTSGNRNSQKDKDNNGQGASGSNGNGQKDKDNKSNGLGNHAHKDKNDKKKHHKPDCTATPQATATAAATPRATATPQATATATPQVTATAQATSTPEAQ